MWLSRYRRGAWTSRGSLLLAVSLVLGPSCHCCGGQPPSEAELSRARQLLRETPIPSRPGNPLAVIRVVNCLQSLGKEQAIALLRQIAPADDGGCVVVDPEGPDDGERAIEKVDPLWDAQRVCTIVPLLFDVEPAGTPPPAGWYDQDRWRWWCGAFVVEDGIPFNTSGRWDLGGSLSTTLPLVEWAAAHGKLRETPLVPPGDPLAAADTLYFKVVARAIPQFPDHWRARRDGMNEFRDHLRAQAIKLLPQALQNRQDLSWDELRKHVAHTGMHWDRDTHSYVIGGDPDIQRCSCPK